MDERFVTLDIAVLRQQSTGLADAAGGDEGEFCPESVGVAVAAFEANEEMRGVSAFRAVVKVQDGRVLERDGD